ncbi:hypothetical protein [Mycolicibacterium austroafricanum]|uniref:hypothetical protein n=1 Tax=Mycolicibacterium austroafricanum TaxID=39687 RepID=UPI001CA36D41|nr:hypothetical protein [Mycolicibacterium austroafricanum]QZT54609.1 hypothetical protein JN084_16285 [Mycolicibacterium austroafricanum]
MTDNSPQYADLGSTLPVDTIVESADLVGLSLSVTPEEGHLYGSLLVATKDGWHRYLLGQENWFGLLDQAAQFADICNDPDKLAEAVETLRRGRQ